MAMCIISAANCIPFSCMDPDLPVMDQRLSSLYGKAACEHSWPQGVSHEGPFYVLKLIPMRG